MTSEIPLATPYPWDSPAMEKFDKSANASLRKRPFVGSGLASLRKNALGSSSTLGGAGKQLLESLLRQNKVNLNGVERDSETDVTQYYGGSLVALEREAVPSGARDDLVLELARNGKLSLFKSILKVVEEGYPSVSTKVILRNCCMTLRPGDLPGPLDAKETVLSALSFLSSQFEQKSDQLLDLPLLKPIQEVGDLEKRSYEISGEWKLVDIKEKLLALEQVFFLSISKWQWVNREKFCPRLSESEETSFFLKGSIPASASGKKAKGESTRKRKAASSPTPPSTSSPVPYNEASLDAEPVVEATIIDDGSPSDYVS